MVDEIARMFSPPKKEKLHETIVAQIRDLIHSHKLGVGDRLPSERDLAKLFKVSRVVIREVLRSLEQSGYVEIKAGAGGGPLITYNLHKPIFDTAQDLVHQGKLSLQYFLEARRTIECATIRFAVEKVTAADLERLREVNKKLHDDLDTPAKLREHNTAFHLAIADIGGNPLLKLMVRSLLDLLGVVLPNPNQSSDFMKQTYERHEAILDAMARKDTARCEELMALDAEHTGKLSVD
jgi:GntR family transcriptional regulator, transcriptional repressor for pyruvate dehydrogenase complex